jgi:hypothetical protein
MRFIIGGGKYKVEDVGDSLTEAFLKLHAAFFGNDYCSLTEFGDSALEFFSDHEADSNFHDKYFNNFTIIWQKFLQAGQYDEAESIWEMALEPALKWEQHNQGKYIHKGTPLYFWAMTSILKGDLDKGYTLMHQALKEDIRTSGKQFPKTPGFFFATLNYLEVRQAFRGFVLRQADYLSKLIESYSVNHGRQFTLEQFQDRFLSNPPSPDTVFLLAYTLARFLQLEKTPQWALLSDFAGQLEMNLLFDVSLVIDSTIKSKNANKWKFIDHMALLARRGKIDLNKRKLQRINRSFNNDFDATLQGLVDGTFKFNDGSNLSALGCDVAITYGLRNHGAHSISSVSTIWNQFLRIKHGLFNALFLAAELLY